MYNALTNRQTNKQTDRPARFVSAFSARAFFATVDIVGRGTAPVLTASPLYFVYQNIFAASPVFPGKRLLSLPESATMRTRSSRRASVVPTRSGFLKAGWRHER